jgi:hypothetical protein
VFKNIFFNLIFKCLVDDDRTVRLVSFQALECILKICKVKRKRVFVPTSDITEIGQSNNGHVDHENGDFAEKSKNGVSRKGKTSPGVRSDNLWLQYKSEMSEAELSEYWEKPFSVKPYLGFYTWSTPTVKLHVTGSFRFRLFRI